MTEYRYRLFGLLAFAGFLATAMLARAHEVRPARLIVSEKSDGRFRVRWKVPAMGDRRIAIDPIFPERCVGASGETEGTASDASVQSWYVTCRGGLADSEIAFSNLSSTMIDVLVRVVFLDGRDYTGLVRPTRPVFRVPARDSESSIFGGYFVLGVGHILFGWDHLLFVLGLVLLVADGRRLVWAITGFTAAHSVTLALATLSVVRVPGPPVEALISLSIVLLAVEVMRYRKTGVETLAIRSPWVVSVAIGLVHGLGFAGALSEYGLPAYAKFISLLAFNLGVEAGQLTFIGSLIVIVVLARRIEPRSRRRIGPLAGRAAVWFIGICGAFWLVQRVSGFFV